MEVKDLFSRRYGLEKPETLWEDVLPTQFYDGLLNVLVRLEELVNFADCFADSARNLAWPLPENYTAEEYVDFLQARPWHETFNSLELIIECLLTRMDIENATWLFTSINHLLERTSVNWKLGESWRFVKRIENVAVIENALRLKIDKFDPARESVRKAWESFNKRPDPDYANSIKEAITAVESAAKIAANSDKADLRKALHKLALHPTLKEGIEKLYAYASDEPGVRHGGTKPSDVAEAEAELMLTICAGAMVFLAKTCVASDERGTAEGAAQ